jgi:predicted nucleotidyltransferase
MEPDALLLEQLVRQIVDAVHPLRIILFGSAARGDMSAHSDLDVLVVMPDGTHQLNAMGELYRKTASLPRPVDILVATPAVLEKNRHTIGLIYKTILAEGKDIYVAS